MQITAQELAGLLKGSVQGNPTQTVNTFAKIEEATNNALSFIANPKYEHYAATTQAGILIVQKDFSIPKEATSTFVLVDDPYACFTQLLQLVEQQKPRKKGEEQPHFKAASAKIGDDGYIGAFAYIGENVVIGDEVQIYPNVYIGDNAVIGDNAILYPGVKVYQHCKIGDGCILHSGVVVGSDGFGFAPQADGSYLKIPQTGNVVLADYVEVGANTVIDRATMGSTVIAEGAKIDNLVQIAHNVEIGAHTVVASQAGISGSTKVGKHCMIGGQAGFVGHITVADQVKVNAQSGVSKSITEVGKAVSGSPAESFRQHYKHQAFIRKIPNLEQRIKALETNQN